MGDPADDFFDLDRLRRKWEPPKEKNEVIVHRVLAGVRPGVDPREEAAEAMRALREACRARLPDRAEVLQPFLEAVEAPLHSVLAEADPAAREAPLAALEKALDQLEELLEVFAFVSR